MHTPGLTGPLPRVRRAMGYTLFRPTASGDLVGITRGSCDHPLGHRLISSHLRQIPSLDGEGSDGLIWVDGRIVTGNVSEMQVHDTDGTNPTRLKSYSAVSSLTRCGAGRVAYTARDATHKIHIARTDILTWCARPRAHGWAIRTLFLPVLPTARQWYSFIAPTRAVGAP